MADEGPRPSAGMLAFHHRLFLKPNWKRTKTASPVQLRINLAPDRPLLAEGGWRTGLQSVCRQESSQRSLFPSLSPCSVWRRLCALPMLIICNLLINSSLQTPVPGGILKSGFGALASLAGPWAAGRLQRSGSDQRRSFLYSLGIFAPK